jgi:hypothetical protein
MFLRELFNSSLPLEWDQSDAPGYVVGRAYDRQGRLIEVNFIRDEGGVLNLEFTRGGSHATTGHSDENIVFGTVINACHQYMRANPDIRVIYFTGDADRQALYSKLAHRLGSAYGFTRAARPGGSVFKLVRHQDQDDEQQLNEDQIRTVVKSGPYQVAITQHSIDRAVQRGMHHQDFEHMVRNIGTMQDTIDSHAPGERFWVHHRGYSILLQRLSRGNNTVLLQTVFRGFPVTNSGTNTYRMPEQ